MLTRVGGEPAYCSGPPAPRAKGVPSSDVRSPPHAAETTVTDATAGQASRFRQLRPNLIATLVRLEPGRPSYALGLRMAIIITIPLGIGVAFGEIGPATVIALAALNGGMADSGGANVTRWHAMGVATFLNAVALAAGTLAGNHIGGAVPLMFVVTFVCAIANLYGNVSANVGFVVSILFIMAGGPPRRRRPVHPATVVGPGRRDLGNRGVAVGVAGASLRRRQ